MSLKIGLIAGSGDFPLEVIKSIRKQKRDVFVIGIKGSAPKEIEHFPHYWIRMGQIGKAIKVLKKNNCKDLIIIGGVKKPNVWLLCPDLGAMKLFFRLILLTNKGDASILKTLIYFLEKDNNFNIIGAEDYIGHLLMSKGLIAGESLSDEDKRDIEIAVNNCYQIGLKDVGQACVVVNEQVISLAKEMNIEFLENKNLFSSKEWKELYKISEKTFVEETDSSKKKGAGAGLIDND